MYMVPPQLLYSHKMDNKHLLWWHNMSAYRSLVADGVAILITTSLVNSVCGNLPFHHWQSGRHVVLVCWNQKSLIEILVSILSIFLFYLFILLFLPPSRASLSGLLPAALQVIYYEWRHCWPGTAGHRNAPCSMAAELSTGCILLPLCCSLSVLFYSLEDGEILDETVFLKKCFIPVQ